MSETGLSIDGQTIVMNDSSTGVKEHSNFRSFDVEDIRRDFPVLDQLVHGKPLVYLDNAATAQKPAAVIEATKAFYEHDNANIHRGLHSLSERATEGYENVRAICKDFLNAPSADEIVFVRGTTEAINLVAHAYGGANIKEGDEILISYMEHHSNIVPWQMLCERKGAILKAIPLTDSGELDLSNINNLITDKTKVVSLVHLSNALGTVNPIERIVKTAHDVGAVVVVDGAQAAPHMKIDVQALGCDFYAFSGHKVYGPTGIGVLWGRKQLLDEMPPYQGGGEMIQIVKIEQSTWNHVPHKFEAGTPNIAGTIGLGVAINYINQFNPEDISNHEYELLDYACIKANAIKGFRQISNAQHKAGILTFTMDGIHAHDIGTIVDSQGVAIRVGHHCTMPLHDHFGLVATARASFAIYNTKDDVDSLMDALRKCKKMFGQM